MQITLVPSGDTFSSVLNEFEANFSLNWVEIKEEFSHLTIPMPDFLIKMYSIRELKTMTDFLVIKFKVAGLDTPKRNRKASLADWLAKVLMSSREVAEVSGLIEPAQPTAQSVDRSPGKDYWCPQCDAWMDRSGFDEVLGSDFQEQLCKVCGSEVCHEFDQTEVNHPDSKIEVLEPEVYTISIVTADGNFSEEIVSQVPPYLVDRKGNLFKKMWHRDADAGYVEIVSEQLSNIAVDSGVLVKLMAENLEVSQACIAGEPPPFIVDRGGVYKRDRVKLSLAIRYAQVVSEYLSNIALV